jgi:hypothetical protein
VPATMADVEEMLEGYEWASEDVMGRKASRGAADLIEARLLDELMALEKVTYCLARKKVAYISLTGQHLLFP